MTSPWTLALAITAAGVVLCGGTVSTIVGATTSIAAAACTSPTALTSRQPQPSAASATSPQSRTTDPNLTKPDGFECVPAGPLGWVQPVKAPVVSGFRTQQRPAHQGVDLGAARGTTIVAVAAGTVVAAGCDIEPAWWGCHRDGHPQQTRGCGFYLDIAHTGTVDGRPEKIISRYCHLGTAAWPAVGQHVAAGQPIGVVGSSGHSSGPHLHFEVHRHGDRSSAGAVDPQLFMASMLAPLPSAGLSDPVLVAPDQGCDQGGAD